MPPVESDQAARRGVRGLLQRCLTHRGLPLGVAIIAVLLSLPALNVGLVGDDYFQRAVLCGSRAFGGLVQRSLDMFAFLDGDAARTRGLIDLGFLPWWVYPEMKAAFWRPLTALTHWLDYRLWPQHPLLMHAQSLAWYGALAAVVALLYRRLMGASWPAGLAALLFAIDDAHALPIAFLANRNALIAALFGVLALLAHDSWRRGGQRHWAVFGPVLLGLSLLAKEEGIATCAYLAAYALILDRAAWRRRIASLLPYVPIVLVWRLVWSGLGYGVVNLGLYADPLGDPWQYAMAVVRHAPYLLLGQWAAPPAEIYIMENIVGATFVRGLWWVGVGLAVLLVWLLAPVLRRERVSRFWALGMVLSLLPVCASFPADRLLIFPGLGATGLLAQFLAVVLGRPAGPPPRFAWRVAAWPMAAVFLLIHVIVAPLALPLRAGHPIGPKSAEQFIVRVPLDASVEQQDVVVVNPPSSLFAAYLLPERESRGLPLPRRARFLAAGLEPMTVRRTDARTLVIRVAGGYINWSFERHFRDERFPMTVGERVTLTGMTVEVTAVTPDGRPAEAAFRFDVPLEDSSLRWLWWHEGEFGPFTPPAVGGQIEIPKVVLRW